MECHSGESWNSDSHLSYRSQSFLRLQIHLVQFLHVLGAYKIVVPETAAERLWYVHQLVDDRHVLIGLGEAFKALQELDRIMGLHLHRQLHDLGQGMASRYYSAGLAAHAPDAYDPIAIHVHQVEPAHDLAHPLLEIQSYRILHVITPLNCEGCSRPIRDYDEPAGCRFFSFSASVHGTESGCDF
jgi:hypothetical protein